MDKNYTMAVMEICEGPLPGKAFFGQYYVSVTLGYSGKENSFIPTKTFTMPLNGPGKNKAIKKVKGQLYSKGLENLTIMIKEDKRTRIV